MADSEREIVVARPAATILLVRDDPFEVLMIRRHPEQHFASALVFPGGMVDDSDRSEDWLPLLVGAEDMDVESRAFRIAAFRETFEEAAILLARDASGSAVACPVDQGLGTASDFRHVVQASGGKLWLDDLAHFGHWITPEPAAKRFDTHFFLAHAPADQEAVCDGGEAVELEWVAPSDVLARADAGERSILFPTRMNLRMLAQARDSAEAMHRTRARTVVTVLPRMEKREGGVAVVIPAEAGYGETENFHPRRKREADVRS